VKKSMITAVLVFLVLYGGQPPAETWGFSIASPLPMAHIEAGSIIHVALETNGPTTFSGVMFTAYGNGGRLLGGNFVVQPPYSWTVQLPPDYTGLATIRALGTMTGPQAGYSPEASTVIYIALPSSVTLNEMAIRDAQKLIFMRPYTSRRLSVLGHYSDGLERDITDGESGTTYSSSNNSVAAVDANGTVTARGAGRAQIIIRNANKEVQMSVSVQLKP